MAVMRRLRRHWSILILVALFAVLLGKGSGLFSAPADPTGATADGAEPPRDVDAAGSLAAGGGAAQRPGAAPDVREADPAATPAAGAAAGAAGTGPAPGNPAADGTGRDGSGDRGAAAAGAPPTSPAAAADAGGADPARVDRVAALVHGARTALQQDRLGACFSHLETLRDAVGADAVPAALEAEARQRLTGLGDELADRLATGEVLHAAAILEMLLEPDSRTVATAVAAWCGERGWPSLLAAGTAQAAEEFAPEPLAKDRAVRLLVASGEPQRSRVVAAGPQRVTVRIVGPSGVTFPTVPAHLVQPEGVTAGEAVELGLAAVSAGDPRRAALWCACALARGGGGERLSLLRRLLG